jgi:hypothetical protein
MDSPPRAGSFFIRGTILGVCGSCQKTPPSTLKDDVLTNAWRQPDFLTMTTELNLIEAPIATNARGPDGSPPLSNLT